MMEAQDTEKPLTNPERNAKVLGFPALSENFGSKWW